LKGVGYNNNDYEDVWLDHQNDFEDLLNNLKQNQSETAVKVEDNVNLNETKISSLEQKSKGSKSRVHYSKFTRSKDLSNRTENDFDCILGTKKRSKNSLKNEQMPNGTENEETLVQTKKVKITTNGDEMDTETTEFKMKLKTNSTSINDYFATKMKQIQMNRDASNNKVDIKPTL
jgi:sulfur carrier protein ThiS